MKIKLPRLGQMRKQLLSDYIWKYAQQCTILKKKQTIFIDVTFLNQAGSYLLEG